MTNLLLTFNVGSSTFKVAAFSLNEPAKPLFRLNIELTTGFVHSSGLLPEALRNISSDYGIEDLATLITNHAAGEGQRVAVLAHRIVHGGRRYQGAQWINTEVLHELEKLEPLCPLHQPPALGVVNHLRLLWPDLPQLVVFDTAFHRRQPSLASSYALPEALRQQGIAAYGFHGISCQHVLRVLREQHSELAGGRVLIAHLGQGASLTAVHHGDSVACSMGFSTLDGLPMGTRCGELDAGVLLYLLEQGWTKSRLTDLLYHQSGLLGLSGISADMRDLLASKSPAARFAVDYFCYRAARVAASLTCAMEGLDTLVFTGGIGEQRPLIREKICRHLHWMGVEIDVAANLIGDTVISDAASSCRILVVAADEEREMSLQCHEQLLHENQSSLGSHALLT